MPYLEETIGDSPDSITQLLSLGRRARHCCSMAELRFLLVNETAALVAYRQAAFWSGAEGVTTLSGVLEPESNAPYVHWLNSLCQYLADARTAGGAVDIAALPAGIADEWGTWLPPHVFWLPLSCESVQDVEPSSVITGGLVLAREDFWSEADNDLLAEWGDIWSACHRATAPSHPGSWRALRYRAAKFFALRSGVSIWRQRITHLAMLVAVIVLFPVRLTVLAPGELVPSNPAVIRSPLEGVVDIVHVQPNQAVKRDQPLFGLDEAVIQSRLDVASQALGTAEAEYRQSWHQALTDAKAKSQLAVLTGKIEEKRAEADYLREQLQRARVLSPRDGIVLFDDPAELIGRPVTMGERIMRVAEPRDIEVEAWVPLGDAIPLEPGAAVSLYLSSHPFSPATAKMRYFAHDAVERPDGSYAYRLRASLSEPTDHRVGLKGTAKLYGGWVPLIYWVLRRPLAAARAWVGY